MPGKSRSSIAASRRPSVNVIATVAIVLLAVLVIGGILLFNRSDDSGNAGTGGRVPSELRVQPDSNTLTEAKGGKVTVVEFLDFQCPVCANYYDQITKKVEKDYAGRITFVTRNFPITRLHPLAAPAAQAAEAAAAQGKYREMYHQLYDNYAQWAIAPDGRNVSDDQQRATTLFESYATAIGLDLAKYRTDLASPAVKKRIEADLAAGEKVGVSGTPTIFVNGKKFEPHGESFADVDGELRTMLDEALG